MRLVFDQNLPPSLVHHLADVFPNAAHVRDYGLSQADDAEIWSHAAAAGYVIVSKDADLRQRAFLLGPPPKVISIRLGNCTTSEVEQCLRARASEIHCFLQDPTAFIMVIP